MATKPITPAAREFPAPRAIPFIHPDDMPDRYALTGVGNCMLPMIEDGACVAFDKRDQPQTGDVVGLIFTRDAARRYGMPGMIKKLVSIPAFGFDGIILVEQINPPRRFAIPSTDVLAVHRMLGIAIRGEDGKATVRLPKKEVA